MNTRRETEWFDDDMLWRALTPLLFSKERCGDAAELVPQALKLVQPTGKHALDLWLRARAPVHAAGPARLSRDGRGSDLAAVDSRKGTTRRAIQAWRPRNDYSAKSRIVLCYQPLYNRR
jgi:hypothetical protein